MKIFCPKNPQMVSGVLVAGAGGHRSVADRMCIIKAGMFYSVTAL